MARALRACAMNRGGKNSVRNLRYGPRTRSVRGIYMHLFCNASQIVRMVILVDLSAIFLASPVSIIAWEYSKWYSFPKLLTLFQGTNRFAALLPQSGRTFQHH